MTRDQTFFLFLFLATLPFYVGINFVGFKWYWDAASKQAVFWFFVISTLFMVMLGLGAVFGG